MKKLPTQFYFCLLTLLAGVQLSAQQSVTGSLPNWEYGSGNVFTGLMTPTKVGSLDDKGNFDMSLKPDYLSEVKEQIARENADDSRKWKSALMTLAKAYNCYTETVEVVNGDQPFTSLSTMGFFMLGNMEEKERFGDMMPATSKEFAQAFHNLGSYNFKEGYSLDWYFVEKEASVKGTCSMDSYAVNQEEMYTHTVHYDLDFKPGWNLVKYEIEEVFTDRDGKTYIKSDRYSIIPEIPSEIEFHFFPK